MSQILAQCQFLQKNLKDKKLKKKLKDTHINSSKCLTDGRKVNEKSLKNANCPKYSRGCESSGRVSLYYPLRVPCASMCGYGKLGPQGRELRRSFFYRIAGPLELILARTREKGQRWLKGQSGSRQLYHGSKQAA